MKALKTVTGKKLLPFCLGLAVLCFCQTGALTAKNRVKRPFKAQLIGTETVPLGCVTICPVDTQGWGVATHTGKYQLEAHGEVDFTAEEAWGEGFMTAANGDQIFFESNLQGGVSTLTITGGTGRFKGASGTIIPTSCSTPIITTDPVAGTMTIATTCAAEGSITY
jgi:hypothetical protein